MCNQFTLHHKSRIDSGRTKFKQGSILYICESHGQGSQRSAWAWLDQTTSCIVQAAEVEKTPRYGVLGRQTACSTKRIEVLSNKMKCNHPLRYTPSLLFLDGCCDGIWRNHWPESICVTSTTTEDFPVGGQESAKEIEKSTLFDHDYVKHSTRTERPVCGSESIQSCVSMPTKNCRRRSNKNGETRKSGGESTKVEELDIDLRVPGLSHAVVKEAEHFRVQELVKKDRKSSSSRSTSSRLAAE